MDTAAVASELQKTWNRKDAQDWAEIYTKIFPSYQLLIESYRKARQVEGDHEQLDKPRAARSRHGSNNAAASPQRESWRRTSAAVAAGSFRGGRAGATSRAA
jgi:hypothetical protein